MESTRSDLLKKSGDNNTMPKPVLRLESLEDFERIPARLREEICRQLGVSDWNEENFDIRIISDEEQYAPHYMRRVRAVNAGAMFLIDCMLNQPEEDKAGLKSTLTSIAEHCCKHLAIIDSEDIRHYQNSLVNYSKVLVQILLRALHKNKKEVMELLDRAEQYACLGDTRPSICTVSHSSRLLLNSAHEFIVQIDVPLNPFTSELKEELWEIKSAGQEPAWFHDLNDDEKKLMKHFLDSTYLDDFGTRINAVSSKLRVIPAPANYARHTLLTSHFNVEANEHAVIVHPAEIRSSHIASRDIPKGNMPARVTHAQRNLLKEIQDAVTAEIERRKMLAQIFNDDLSQHEIVIPILYQTLITPFKDPDSLLHHDRTEAVTVLNNFLADLPQHEGDPKLSFVIIATNHPLNYGKYVAPTTSWSMRDESTKDSIETLLFLLRAALKRDAQHQLLLHKPPHLNYDPAILSATLDALETHTMQAWSVEPYRELYLSSLEQLAVSQYGGISIGSCVSGKDRKAVEIAHTDALKIYFAAYKKLPPLTAKNPAEENEMQAFADIFADIYCTKHQMAVAELNAQGSFGIKTPDMYLPKQLKDAIKKWYRIHEALHPSYAAAIDKDTLKESDIMASNNEVDHFKPRDIPDEITDLAWNQDSLNILTNDTQAIEEQIIYKAIKASLEYLATRDDRRGFLSRLSGDESGKYRALLCQVVLGDTTLTSFQKIVFLHTFISSNLGSNLITDIVKALDMGGMETTIKTLQDYLHLHAKENGTDAEQIREMGGHIFAILNTVKQYEQIAKYADAIANILMHRTSPQPDTRK